MGARMGDGHASQQLAVLLNDAAGRAYLIGEFELVVELLERCRRFVATPEAQAVLDQRIEQARKESARRRRVVSGPVVH